MAYITYSAEEKEIIAQNIVNVLNGIAEASEATAIFLRNDIDEHNISPSDAEDVWEMVLERKPPSLRVELLPKEEFDAGRKAESD